MESTQNKPVKSTKSAPTKSTSTPARRKPKPEVFMMKVGKGCFFPADTYTSYRLRERGYKIDDLIACTFKKLNNPGFHRLVHHIGQLCAENIEAFENMDSHSVIKRIQWEANICCEEVGVMVPGVGLALMRFPKSLAFESMDDGERHDLAKGICRHIAQKYWNDTTAEAIEKMASSLL